MITKEHLQNKIKECTELGASLILEKQEYADKCNEKIQEAYMWRDFYEEALKMMEGGP